MTIKWHVQRIGYFICSLVLLGSVLSAGLSEAAIYYVAPNGKDSNAGTQASPFRTVSHGINVLKAGDTLYVRAGTYNEALNILSGGGTSWSNPVTVAAYPSETVTVRAPAGSEGAVNFWGPTVQYFIFDGFIVDAINLSGFAAVYIGDGAHHIRMKNAEIKNAPKSGLLIGGTFLEFIHLDVHDNGGDRLDHGIYITSSNNLIEGSSFHHNSGYGIHLFSESGGVNNNTVRNNKAYSNRLSAGIILSKGDGNIAYNNVVWGNGGGGIQIDYSVRNPAVYNNTVYANSGFGGIYIGAGSSAAIVRNNIVYQNTAGITNDGNGSTMDHNLVSIDPKFVNPAANDFQLQAGSPAIDAGVSLTKVPTDFAGVARPQGAGYDIGAYEYNAGLPPPPSPPTNFRVVQQ